MYIVAKSKRKVSERLLVLCIGIFLVIANPALPTRDIEW